MNAEHIMCTGNARVGTTTKRRRNIEFAISGAVCTSAIVCEVSPRENEVGDRVKVPPGVPQVETSVSRWRKVPIYGRLIED